MNESTFRFFTSRQNFWGNRNHFVYQLSITLSVIDTVVYLILIVFIIHLINSREANPIHIINTFRLVSVITGQCVLRFCRGGNQRRLRSTTFANLRALWFDPIMGAQSPRDSHLQRLPRRSPKQTRCRFPFRLWVRMTKPECLLVRHTCLDKHPSH